MRQPPAPPRTPRPVAAFFLSLAGSAVALTMLVASDGRVLELKKAREDARHLDLAIARLRQENRQLKAAVEAARRHEFPAEKVAREELHLVHPEDLVLLYPDGSLSEREKWTARASQRASSAEAAASQSSIDGRQFTTPKPEPRPR